MKLMLKLFERLAMGVGFALAGTAIAKAQVCYTLPAIDHGAYDESGFHDQRDEVYVTGFRGLQYRSFFVFDRTLLPASFERAELRLFLPEGGYDSPHATENLVIYKVNSTSIGRLTGGGSGMTSVYSDLGGGSNFGSRRISRVDEGNYVSVPLNDTFESFLGTVTGVFGIGARVSTLSGSAAQNLFNVAEGGRLPADAVQLVAYSAESAVSARSMAPVPEPSTYSLFAGAVLLMVIGFRTYCRKNP